MFILTQIADSIGTITLNQPAKRNALSHALIEEMIAALASFQHAAARAVIIRAAADAKVWSAGHDINELPQGADPLQYSDPLEHCSRRRVVSGSRRGDGARLGVGRRDRSGVELRSDRRRRDLLVRHHAGQPRPGLQHGRPAPFHATTAVEQGQRDVLHRRAGQGRRGCSVGHSQPPRPRGRFGAVHLRSGPRDDDQGPARAGRGEGAVALLARAAPLTPETFERMQELRQRVYRSEDYLEGIRAFHEKRKPLFQGK